jgi:outer membrane lipoprotein-sorting protein
VRGDEIAVNRARKVFSVILLLVAGWMSIGWADTWEGIRGAAGTIQTIRADFVQEKHLSILSRPLVSRGVFYYQAPNSLRWEYTSPVRSILLMHNGAVTRYTQTDKGLVQESQMDAKGIEIILQEIALWLGGRFSDDPAFAATLEPGRKIVLRPKEEGFSKMIQHIDLSLSDTPGIIKSVSIYEGPDSYTRLVFTNTAINEKIEEALFMGIS